MIFLNKNEKRLALNLFGLFLALCYLPSFVQAKQEASFNSSNGNIEVSVKYSVIGKYRAIFENFNGTVVFDYTKREILGVYLELIAESIKSNCEWCDDVVRSSQLLSVKEYPKIVFDGMSVDSNDNQYYVDANLDIHGKSQLNRYPFEAEFNENNIRLKGVWTIDRKSFGIIWNQFLDKGGVLVGNMLTVDWAIEIPINKEDILL